jgi:hypothetical protein
MPVINSMVKLFLKDRLKDIDAFINNPILTQSNILSSLISSSKETSFGKAYAFEKIKNSKEFKKRVPLHHYEDFKPYIERIFKGEDNVIWPTPIRWFAKSSGTTNDKSKFIPISHESLEDCHYKSGKDLLACFCKNKPDSNMFKKGKGLIIGGSHELSRHNDDIVYGDLSAVLLQNLPFLARYFRTPSLETALLDNWDKKLEQMALETINENVTQISGVPSWTLVLINKLFEISGKDNLMEIWPNLELYMHGGVSFTPYEDQYKSMINGPNMAYYETYNASEGFFAFQNEPEKKDLLLLLNHGIYYEFIPMDEVHKEQPITLDLTEVKAGENYAIVISTNAGLWRYVVGDTIRFTSTFPFKIQVSGRIKHFINAFGEELIIENAENALAHACKNTNARIQEYTAAPIYFSKDSSGGHEWIIEFEKLPDDIVVFTKELDKSLKSLNSDYEAKRYNDYTIKMPVIKLAPKGLFYKWLKNKGKLGGQHKIPRLSNDRKHIEELLLMF